MNVKWTAPPKPDPAKPGRTPTCCGVSELHPAVNWASTAGTRFRARPGPPPDRKSVCPPLGEHYRTIIQSSRAPRGAGRSNWTVKPLAIFSDTARLVSQDCSTKTA